MAKGMNKVTIIGNLGQDPEVRYTQGGDAVCNFSLAVNGSKKVGDKWEDHVEWINIVVFGKTAENAGQYLSKGRQVYVEGALQTRKWQDKEGSDRWSTEVKAFEVMFLGSKPDGDGERAARPAAGARPPRGSASPSEVPAGHDTPVAPGASDGFIDDDLPF